MQYTIVVAKDVAIPPQAFVAAWNADPACRTVAYARIDDSIKSVYEPGVTSALPLLEMEATNICRPIFYNLITRTLQTHKQTEIIQLEKPNGERVLVIKGIDP